MKRTAAALVAGSAFLFSLALSNANLQCKENSPAPTGKASRVQGNKDQTKTNQTKTISAAGSEHEVIATVRA